MLVRIIEDSTTYGVENITGTSYSTAIDMDRIATLSIQSVIDVNTPSAKTFPSSDVNTTTDAITEVAHGFYTGLKGQFTTTGALPTGISGATDYFIIKLTDDTFQAATSLSNALAGTAVNITAQGSGDDTFTPTAIAGGTISYQRTNVDNPNNPGTPSTTATDWADIDAATAVTADATNWFSVVGPTWRWTRVKGVVTAGMMTFVNHVLARGEDKS